MTALLVKVDCNSKHKVSFADERLSLHFIEGRII